MICKVNNGEIAKELFKPFEPVFKEKDSDCKSTFSTEEERRLIEELVGMTDTISGDIQSAIKSDNQAVLCNK